MVKETVKSEVRDFLGSQFDRTYADLSRNLNPEAAEALAIELKQYQQPGCWEWNALWDAQINHTWETYAVAVPLGHPQQALSIANLPQPESEQLAAWIAAQTAIANPRDSLPTTAESSLYQTFNVGSWWGSYQARLGQLIQAVKNTRNWQVPTAPGERSSISGLYSALHPRLLYRDRFRNGCGVANSSLKLFWQIMALVYPGLFNGSERLNAIELTKRMAWKYGGVAAALGITEAEAPDLLEAPDIDRTVYTAPNAAPDLRDFDNLIRFPNLSSIAAARFAHDHPDQVKAFWHTLSLSFKQGALKPHYRKFCQLTRRPFQIGKVDCAIAGATQRPLQRRHVLWQMAGRRSTA
ncbi:MAG: hypothetical protein HC895_27465 [Leptolyngbyaceae cyanobacterium SM1_3_5]|nr:hypothetical protein [Leptolyngbyaceae cyanobacterium SM1_3_5]